MEDTADTGYNQVGIENWDKGTKGTDFYHSWRTYRFRKNSAPMARDRRNALLWLHKQLLGENKVLWQLEKRWGPARRLGNLGPALDFQSHLGGEQLSHREVCVSFSPSYWELKYLGFPLQPANCVSFCNNNKDVATETSLRNGGPLPLTQQPQSEQFSNYDCSLNKTAFQPASLLLPKVHHQFVFKVSDLKERKKEKRKEKNPLGPGIWAFVLIQNWDQWTRELI